MHGVQRRVVEKALLALGKTLMPCRLLVTTLLFTLAACKGYILCLFMKSVPVWFSLPPSNCTLLYLDPTTT